MKYLISWSRCVTTPVRYVLVIVVATALIAGTAMTEGDDKPRDEAGIGAHYSVDSALMEKKSRGSQPRPRAQATDRRANENIVTPDLMVLSTASLSRAVIETIAADRRVKHSITVDGGQAQIAGLRMNTLGVRPLTFRRWAPPATAAAKGLWAALAHGGVNVAPEYARLRGIAPGGTYLVGGHSDAVIAGAAVHEIGIPNMGALVSRRVGERLGLTRNVAMLIDVAPEQSTQLAAWLRRTVSAETRVVTLRDLQNTVPVSTTSANYRPRSYLDLYRQSVAYCPGLHWSVLAAIGQIESGHGRNNGPSSAGALGPMQFMPSTWQAYGLDADGDGKRDSMSPFDAVPAAAKYLCVNGASGGGQALYDAIFAYNHADWYVREVLQVARLYRHTYGD